MKTITRFITSKNRHKVALCSLSLLALFLLVWHLGTSGQGGPGAGLPGPAAAAAEFIRCSPYGKGKLLLDLCPPPRDPVIVRQERAAACRQWLGE